MLTAFLLPLVCPAQTHSAHKAATANTSETSESATIKKVFWQPNQLLQGSPAFFTVELSRPATRVSGTFAGKRLSFFKGEKPDVWYALGGDDLETKPDSYDLTVTAVLRNGRTARSVKKVDVSAGTFTSGTADVAEDYVEPTAMEQRQIARDEVVKKRAYAHDTPLPLWSGNFIKPVAGPSTPSFGETRVLNEEKTSRHMGTDFPVNEGTPVVASNAGTVVLAQELYYEGNCVIIDHGQRFFTIYMHLSKMEVKVGERLRKDQRIGLAGKTGRATGPHLHMGVRWDGAFLDPVELLKLTLPNTGASKPAERAAVHGRR